MIFTVVEPVFNGIIDVLGQQIGQQKYFHKSVDQLMLKKRNFGYDFNSCCTCIYGAL